MKKPEPTNEEVKVDVSAIISRTDLKGNIIFVNRAFTKITGYSKQEVYGKPHSILRHPDMPKAAFKSLWETVKADKEFRGFVKNLTKNGDFYWVEVFVEPFFVDGEKIGYIAGRRNVTDEDKNKTEKLYQVLLEKEKKGN